MSTSGWFAYVFQSVLLFITCYILGSSKRKNHTLISRGLVLTLCVLEWLSCHSLQLPTELSKEPLLRTPCAVLGAASALPTCPPDVENRNGNCLFPSFSWAVWQPELCWCGYFVNHLSYNVLFHFRSVVISLYLLNGIVLFITLFIYLL